MHSAVILLFLVPSLAGANELPSELYRIPRVEDYDWGAQLSGRVHNREELAKRPRVIFGYLSEKDWAMTEFVSFLHASWRYVTSLAEPTGYRLDLMVFADVRWLREVSKICEPITLRDSSAPPAATTATGERRGGGGAGGGAGGGGRYPQLRRPGNASTCWTVPYPRPPDRVWQGYPFVASYHFLADPRVADLMISTYGYAMKTDFDCLITPTLIQHFPQHLQVGYMHYTPLPETEQRLRRVAARLGLRHRGLHDIGPTWYGDTATLISVANASLPLVYHLLDQEFDKMPDGSWRRSWASGEGWPEWSRDMAVMYGPDIVLNHLVHEWEISRNYDVNGDSRRYTFTLYHIHCQHGDEAFNKFEFFRHKYADRDLTTGLDFNLVRDYTLFLSVSTWRQLEALQGAPAAAPTPRMHEPGEL